MRLGHVVEGKDAQAQAGEQEGAEGDEDPERELLRQAEACQTVNGSGRGILARVQGSGSKYVPRG